ncbi:hypothetical protein SprV_0200540000 [Sparganum proliferum]
MPRDLLAEAIDGTSVNLTWKPPLKTDLETKYYAVKVGERQVEIDYRRFNGTYTFGGLKRLIKYDVSVRVGYKNPDYLASAAVTTVTIPPSSRDQPTGMRLDVYSSNTIRVVWESPMDTDFKVDNYRLNISGDRTESLLVGTTYRTLIGNLTPSTTYVITLEAKYAGTDYFGRPAEKSASTFAKGTDMPRDLLAEAIDGTSVNLTWKPPLKTDLETKYYAVKVGERQVEIDYRRFNGTYTFGGLKRLIKYDVSVRVGYKNPDYLASAAVTTVTIPPSRTDMPRDLLAEAIDGTSVNLTWKPPLKTDLETKYYAVKVGERQVEIDYRRFNGTYTFGGLKRLIKYDVSVRVGYKNPDYLASAAVTTVTIPPSNILTCGFRNIPYAEMPPPPLSPRREVIQHSWPWTVGLYSSVRGGYPYCGATLLAPLWVITAAHCVEMAMNCTSAPVGTLFSYHALTNATLFARIGDHDLTKTEASEKDRLVEGIVLHPQYQVQTGSSENDIALLRLQRPVLPGAHIDFVCLPRSDSTFSEAGECAFAGWGSLFHSRILGHRNSPVLTEGRVQIESQEFCHLNAEHPESEALGCLATRTAIPCWGDSGSGVYCLGPQERWILYGIINRGSFLCERQYATSTKIFPYVDWIEETIATNTVE